MIDQVIVTGANGFLASNLVEALLSKNYRVLGLILNDNQWSMNFKHPNLELFKVDITDLQALSQFFASHASSQTIVIHTAGVVSIASKVEPLVEKVNVGGTKNVIEVCQKHQVKRLVYTSSVHAIPELPRKQQMAEVEQFSPDLVVGGYAKTKAAATQLVVESRQSGLDAVIVHPSGIIGPGDYGQSNIKQAIVDYLNRKMTAVVRGGYDFVDVRDVVDGIIKASFQPNAANQNYILSGQFYEMIGIIRLIDQLYPERRHHLNILPVWFLKIVARLAEIWYQLRRVSPTFTAYSVYTLNSNSNFSHQKASRELDYHPRPMVETLRDTVEWYKRQNLLK